MILDDRLEFFDGVSIPAAGTALVGDQIDLEVPRDIGNGEDLYWYVAVEAPAVGGTSIKFELITSAAAAMSAPVVLAESPVIPLASLNANRLPVMLGLPAEGTPYLRYLGVRAVVVGTFTDGTLSSGFTLDKSGFRAYPGS